jgi:hypothetical protein
VEKRRRIACMVQIAMLVAGVVRRFAYRSWRQASVIILALLP